jgi:hypothetical protein
MDESDKKADLTFGGKSAAVSFNPSAVAEVDEIKKAAANFIDAFTGPAGEKILPEMQEEGTKLDGEVVAMRKLALRKAQEASMWAVKAATWHL